jgi:hypothetical protein
MLLVYSESGIFRCLVVSRSEIELHISETCLPPLVVHNAQYFAG